MIKSELLESPIGRLLNSRILEIDETERMVRVEMEARPDFINPAGTVHGGMLAAMLDETIGLTLSSCLGPEEFPVTVEIKVCFIAGAKAGPLIGTGKVVSLGRSICFVEGRLNDPLEGLVATATATMKISSPGK